MRVGEGNTPGVPVAVALAPRRRIVVCVGPLGSAQRWLALAGLTLLATVAFAGTGYRYRPLSAALDAAALAPAGAAPPAATLAELEREDRRLRTALGRNAPKDNYIVIDQSGNRLYVKNGDAVVLEAVCSAGSGMLLREGEAGRSWIFDTPRGAFRVLNRIQDPVWRKPDWAFVEEGKPIPRDPDERIEYGTLGEYALYFGNGYMIHGTLYERLLGRSVTHGCIRLGRDDLRQVWKSTRMGTPIFIY